MTSRRLVFALLLVAILFVAAAVWLLAPQPPLPPRASLRTETPTATAPAGWWDTPMPTYPVTQTPTPASTPAP